jgi:DNA-binding winged helix-turn-helix (wHTH) protein/predicted ATPase/type II secretory pathway predicted ATPase ExeA
MLHFDRFRFDGANQRLEDPSGPIFLNPKAFEVLRVLVERPGQLVLKDQILDEVWRDTHVGDGVLKVCIAEVRKALGDSASEPRFIETVHRRGYRFVAQLADASSVEDRSLVAERPGSLLAWPADGVPTGRSRTGLVGRDGEIEWLEERFAAALNGERQVVFVTGEAGAGKTALIEHFVTGVARRETVAITGGQCLQQFGSAEAYMPVLEAVSRMVRKDAAVRLLLRRYAPAWFAQSPWLVEEEDRDRLGNELRGTARERMLREMAEFVEALGAEIPLVLVLDDLHWSDPSTVDLLSLLAERRERARLLVLATYRPAELILARHPLRAVSQRLAAGQRSAELVLDDLGVKAVGEYLERRFAASHFSSEVARLIRERTDGNPLFLVTLIDHLVARGAIAERDQQWQATETLRGELVAVPESLRRLIEQQIERLQPEERQLLEAASLVELEFSAAAAAAGANRDPGEAEEHYARLASASPLLRHAGSVTWPDGTVTGCFAFRHPLYREVLAAAVPARRRADSHLRIGDVLERAYRERSSELGAELALHFEEGGDRARAARYRRLAAETATRRYAFAEAETHLEKGLALLTGLPASPERDREERSLQSALGAVRMATRGYAAPEVERAYTRALELSSAPEHEPLAFPELWGLWSMHLTRAELDRALEFGVRMQTIAETSGDRLLRLHGHLALWMTHFFRGELAASLHHLDEGEPLYDPTEHRGSALVYGQDAGVLAISHRSVLLWSIGRVDESLKVTLEAVDRARTLGHPLTLALTMMNAGWIRLVRGEPRECREQAEGLLAYATEQGVPFWIPNGLLQRGWALAAQGELERGIADAEQGLTLKASMETGLGQTPHYAHLALNKARLGHFSEAHELIERCKTLVAQTGERYYEPEIHRLHAELLLAELADTESAPPAAREKAEALLDAAIDCAQRQGARTLELRATTSLVRLGGHRTARREARDRLADLLATFTEGFDTADLREASQLVAGDRPPRPRRSR